jgi:2-phosphoglycerate kinase
MPAIHHSSFEAGRALAGEDEDRADAQAVLDGFLEQTREVLVGVRAAIDRALEEGWSMVLEGVHLVPGMLPPIEGALAVHVVLEIENEEEHAGHFFVRDIGTDGLRPVDRYLEALGDIRFIQDYIVERARRAGVPVVENSNIELAIATVMELVLSTAERMGGCDGWDGRGDQGPAGSGQERAGSGQEPAGSAG